MAIIQVRAPDQRKHRPSRYGFAGHETFPFRYGWLKKAVDGVRQQPRLFSLDDAIVRLGVGKNMVDSIRHWGLATRLLEETQGGELGVTSIGAQLLERWDPYLEDPASLWLIHWLLVTNPARAATWWLAFSRYPRSEFTKRHLLHYVADFAAREVIRVKESTLSRDVDCFVRTYWPARASGKGLVEDGFDCPLVELGLLQPFLDGESYQFVIGPKSTLPPALVAYAILSYWDSIRPDRQTLAISDCLFGESSPGQVFKLDENSLIEYAEELHALTDGRLQLDETVGLKQIYRSAHVDSLGILERYYIRRSKG